MIYLKNRHHDKIFFDDFAFDKADSIELSFIIYYIKHPDVNDSVKLELRNNIKTTSDIEKYMNWDIELECQSNHLIDYWDLLYVVLPFLKNAY